MKATGIVRKIDELGRVVIPKETREMLDINNGDSLEIYVEDKSVYLKKHYAGCVFCGEASNTISFKGYRICQSCKNELEKKAAEKAES